MYQEKKMNRPSLQKQKKNKQNNRLRKTIKCTAMRQKKNKQKINKQ